MSSKSKHELIQSMTGYGESSYEGHDVYLHVSMKTVNSKYLDVDAHLPRAFVKQELEWRKLFTQQLKRGRVFFTLTCQMNALEAEEILNKEALKAYSQCLQKLCTSLGLQQDILAGTLRLPGVVRSEAMYKVSKEVQTLATKTVLEALQQCVLSREQEGARLIVQLKTCLTSLHKHLNQLDEQVAYQQTNLKAKLQERLAGHELTPQEWEQEFATSLNKVSIEEEKVRLKSHLDFFEKTLEEDQIIGKKLGFIIQELGRELNTIGAKAQYGPLQHLAVNMKELVEQMREQIANLV